MGTRDPVRRYDLKMMAAVVCSLIRAVLDLRETPVMVVYLDRRWVQLLVPLIDSPSAEPFSSPS